MAPTPEQIRVALDAMRADARTWSGMSDEMAAAGRAAGRLDLTRFHFTAAGDAAGVTDLYGSLQRRIVALLGEAAVEFDSLGAALRSAADGYEDDDRASAHRIKNVY